MLWKIDLRKINIKSQALSNGID